MVLLVYSLYTYPRELAMFEELANNLFKAQANPPSGFIFVRWIVQSCLFPNKLWNDNLLVIRYSYKF